jgi:hypothetical protein
MKKFFTLFAAMAMMAITYAQLPDGATAPDFQLYEIDKTTGQMITSQTINLYGMLNDYKVVYMDVSATTCSPCYSFHKGGTLETIYNNYGPNSSVNDSRVLFVEGAQTGNSWPNINGTGNGWDCTHIYNSSEYVPYPVIPLFIAPNYVQGDANCNYYTFHSGYAISYFPTIYMVCPNRMVFNLNNSSSNVATQFHNAINTKCPAWTNDNDAMIGLQNVMDPMFFCDNGITPKVVLQNLGTNALTSATFRVTVGNNVETRDWAGNIAQFESEVISLSPVAPAQNGEQDVTVEIIKANGVDDQGSKYNTHTETVSVQMTSDIPTASQKFTSSNLSPWFLADHTGGNCARYMGALRFKAWDIPAGGTAEFFAPLMNFTTNLAPTLTFDVAHRRYQTRNEKLEVLVSTDCGENWTTVYSKEGEDLATVTSGTGEFNASTSDYRTETVDLSYCAGNAHVIIKFVFTSGYGNNVFIDNVNIDGPLAIETVDNNSLSIFPNPVKDVLNINYDKAISQIDVYDVNGKRVKTFTTVNGTINISDLSNGVYMLNMQTEDGLVIRKIVKE